MNLQTIGLFLDMVGLVLFTFSGGVESTSIDGGDLNKESRAESRKEKLSANVDRNLEILKRSIMHTKISHSQSNNTCQNLMLIE